MIVDTSDNFTIKITIVLDKPINPFHDEIIEELLSTLDVAESNYVDQYQEYL